MTKAKSNQDWIVSDSDELQELVIKLGTQGSTYQDNVHRAVASCAFLLQLHQNYSIFNQLVQYLPDGGLRIDRMKEYIHFEFGAVWKEEKHTFKKDKEWGGAIRTIKDADDADILDIGYYREKKWYNYGKAKNERAFDTVKQISALTKKLRDNADTVADERVKAMGSAFDLVNTMDEMGLTSNLEIQEVA